MHCTPSLKIIVSLLISMFLPALSVCGQVKTTAEPDITKCWTYRLADAAGERIDTDGHRLFVGLEGGAVEALSIDAKKIWSAELGGEISSNIFATDGGLFLVTSAVSSDALKPSGSKLRSLSKETGVTNWTVLLSGAGTHSIGGFGDAIVVISKSGAMEWIDAKSGHSKWKREIPEGLSAEPVFTATDVVVATTGKQILSVSLAAGAIESTRKVAFTVTALDQTAGNELVTGDERGNVSLYTNGTGKPDWTFKSGGEVSSILSVGDNLLVSSKDNFVYFLVGRNGGRAWKKRLPARVSQVLNVADRYAIVSSVEEHGAVLVDLANGKAAGQIVLADDESLVSAPVVSNGMIFVLTNDAVHAFGLSGCSTK